MKLPSPMRVVFDTNVVISALLFRNGRLAWLRAHWSTGFVIPLVSEATFLELVRVLSHRKFGLTHTSQAQLLSLYLPHCRSLNVTSPCPITCRDPKDQPLLDLAHSGHAHILVTGDQDLLALAGQTVFEIETPEQYRTRFER